MKKRDWTHGTALFSVIILLLGFFSCLPREKAEFSARIKAPDQCISSFEGETVEMAVWVENRGRATWNPEGEYPCFLSYHLLDGGENVIRFDNPRSALPRKIHPGEKLEISLRVKSPIEPGDYILELDFVREGHSWFKDYGSPTLKIPFHVRKRAWPEDEHRIDLDYGRFTRVESGIEEFNMLARLIRITLSHNEVEFEGKTGVVKGFAPGTDYPQVWLRDAVTIIPASRYYYSNDFLSPWLEEHLTFQKDDGSLEDWIDAGGQSDKNTTETDQEASAVQAAWLITRLRGADWLLKKISGETIIDRLERALSFVLAHRFDEKVGLVKGAHTADWGDVDFLYGDEKAIYTDENTRWTSGIYNQAMFHQACRELALMLYSLGRKDRASFWKSKADLIRKNANQRLWQEDRGFYRVHLHLDSLTHDFDEDDIFAMGGNTLAVLSGLATGEKSRRIIDTALSRQRAFAVSTISGTLLPPYPKNFFRHPMMDDPFEYQNGGQWDWFGGRLVHAMFRNGFSRAAREKLLEIARKNLRNGGFFEWDDRQGTGRGSDHFCGSAGSLGMALFEGYFGLNIAEDSLSLEPRLGRDEARVHVHIPAADFFAAYDYRFSPEEEKILFRFNSNFSGTGKVRILSPWISSEDVNSKRNHAAFEVKLDDEKILYSVTRLNNDEFIVIETDFQRRSLEIRKIDGSTTGPIGLENKTLR